LPTVQLFGLPCLMTMPVQWLIDFIPIPGPAAKFSKMEFAGSEINATTSMTIRSRIADVRPGIAVRGDKLGLPTHSLAIRGVIN
jgi:hypothetical protein